MTTFESLGVSNGICTSLKERGITEAFPIQEMTIPDGLAGRDICGKAKTGSGKTLAFGIPILEQVADADPGHPRALMLVPTRELATQVSEELSLLAQSVDRKILAVYGGAPMQTQIDAIDAGADIIVATPGRLIDLIDRKAVFVDRVDFVVIDEADRMADMGFLPQVEWILRNVEGNHQTLLFSATLDGAVDTLISRYQTDPVKHEVEEDGVTVDQMEHRFILVHQMDKPLVAAAIVKAYNKTLLFTRTKRAADRVAERLEDQGIRAAAIHGDLRQTSREKSLKQFTEGKIDALVATDVAARGIHVDEVDVVVHYDPADDSKTYLHRSGRTARAGADGVAVTLSLWDEELEVRRMQKRIGLELPIVEMFSNDPRLQDLVAWDPLAEP